MGPTLNFLFKNPLPPSDRPFSTISRSLTPSKTLILRAAPSPSPMAASEDYLRRSLAEKQTAVDAQSEAVRALKALPGVSEDEIDAAVEVLKALKVEHGAAKKQLRSAVSGKVAFQKAVENTLKRRFFLIRGSMISGEPLTYRHPGSAFKSNVLDFWRQHFVLEEYMMQVDRPCVISEYMLPSGVWYLVAVRLSVDCRCMWPKTAQGIPVNFKYLYDYNDEKLPFAAAGTRVAFRNEISPCQGLFRDGNFTLAEIEHFVDHEDKSHPKFVDVAGLEFLMFPREEQLAGKSVKSMVLGEAVSEATINNETLGYFIGRVYLFLTRLGIDKDRLRFRQHLPNEMAQYAADCWDAEIECSYGWIECVGIADRSAYDLLAHLEKSRVSEPREVEKLVITPSEEQLGLAFKGNQRMVVEALEAMSEKEALEMKEALDDKGEADFQVCTLGKSVRIKKNMVSISMERKEEHQTDFYNLSVITLSFVTGRIIYCLFEHSFYTRPSKSGDVQRNVFRFPLLVAPIKCTVFPLIKSQQFVEVANLIAKSLKAANISHELDVTGKSIGKRYAISDELGVPYAITVDSTASVTMRQRDSKEQIRVSIEEVVSVVKKVTVGQSTWADVLCRYPTHVATHADEL
ncbi:glycine--tRNA ligase, mitochondrial 1-like [Phoenix dactylifera]|uniref:glycine--tRNA ligase n=1 Tax=Phoenix dactylifera TaxID=42345 RepID=A0A8B9A4U3_PHODC|nr:glycine--tRNA ligase, mitochondrial 1-like [Phoenix dactylifera]